MSHKHPSPVLSFNAVTIYVICRFAPPNGYTPIPGGVGVDWGTVKALARKGDLIKWFTFSEPLAAQAARSPWPDSFREYVLNYALDMGDYLVH